MFLLATDLDRTLLPNGPMPRDDGLEILFEALKTVPHLLVYVTGRNLNLVYEAQKEYNIPTPDYLIAEVGTSMFHKEGDNLVPETRWIEYIQSQEHNWNRERITTAIGTENNLTPQEEWKQNPFKISYYLPSNSEKEGALGHIAQALASIGVVADVLFSIDPLKDNIGLIDVLPKTATKATAVEFLRKQEGFTKDNTLYAGDSGNDILPLSHCYRSVLVKNAPEEVKDLVTKRVAENGCSNTLYIATGVPPQNGNYASGILEGLRHFGFVPSI